MKRFLILMLVVSIPLFGIGQGIAVGNLYTDSAAVAKRFPIFPIPATFGYKQPQPIPGDLHTRNFGFFCRQELKMQQAHVPVTFRLGSMDECNRLEQKPGYR